jgi:hypothetical protein
MAQKLTAKVSCRDNRAGRYYRAGDTITDPNEIDAIIGHPAGFAVHFIDERGKDALPYEKYKKIKAGKTPEEGSDTEEPKAKRGRPAKDDSDKGEEA